MSGATCTCGATFRIAEDFRDHMPCPGSAEEQAIEKKAMALIAEVIEASKIVQANMVALKVDVEGLKPRIQLRDKQLRIALDALQDVDGPQALEALAEIERLEKESTHAH